MNESSREPDPFDPWDTPPWEDAGKCRADALPHRGALLRRLGNVGFFLAVTSCYPYLICCVPYVWYRVEKNSLDRLLLVAPATGLGLLALVIGATTVGLANNDVAEMRRGLVDPNGELETEFARRRASVGIVIGIASVVVWGVIAVWGAF